MRELFNNKSLFFREDEACPDVCGRRCQRRVRLCNGPYHLACVGQGRAEEFSDCDALNNAVQASGNGFQRSTTTANFALYTNNRGAGDQSSNSDDYNQRHNNETADTADEGLLWSYKLYQSLSNLKSEMKMSFEASNLS